MSEDWSRGECRAIVADYFAMLEKELRGLGYVKAHHRRALAPHLRDRSESSIERKHMNVSAALLDLGFPYIDGYKPYSNYQALLRAEVEGFLAESTRIADLVERDVVAEAAVPTIGDILGSLEQPPIPAYPEGSRYRGEVDYTARIRKIDYLEREARNQSLGYAGEEFVTRFEQARLVRAGKDRLAGRVERVSETRGDGTGFDILSFEESGSERFVEVKTTRYGKETPFFATANEVRFSEGHAKQYHLYRCFGFRGAPRLFTVGGPISSGFSMESKVYQCRVAPAGMAK